MIRSSKITRSARGKACTMHAPGCTGGGADTTFCHSNMQVHGKGKGVKAHDIFGFYGCRSCHDWYDRGPASREVKEQYFLTAHARTLLILVNENLIVVVGYEHQRF